MGSLLLLVVAPAEALHPGGDGSTGSGRPIDIISAGTLAQSQIGPAVRYEFVRLRRLDDAARAADGSRTAAERRFA